jgi:hypothetical protein
MLHFNNFSKFPPNVTLQSLSFSSSSWNSCYRRNHVEKTKTYRVSYMYFIKCGIYRRLRSIFKFKLPNISSPSTLNSYRKGLPQLRFQWMRHTINVRTSSCQLPVIFVWSLFKIIMYIILGKIPNMKFHENPSCRRSAVAWGWTDFMNLAVDFAKFFVKAPNNCSTK